MRLTTTASVALLALSTAALATVAGAAQERPMSNAAGAGSDTTAAPPAGNDMSPMPTTGMPAPNSGVPPIPNSSMPAPNSAMPPR